MVENIMNSIMASTEMNFQRKIMDTIDVYCDYLGINFEKVEPANSDGKNDGWIPTKNIYFGAYSPND